MSIFFILFFIVMILILVLLFTVALKIIFTFNSDGADVNLTLLWLYPILKITVKNKDIMLILTVYIINKRVFTKALKPGKNKTNNADVIKKIKLNDVIVDTSYGFRDPFITGIVCGAINMISELVNSIKTINQTPNFVADNDYIYLRATAKTNLALALTNLYKAYNSNSKK